MPFSVQRAVRREREMMIGFYNYTIILTFLGLVVSVFGMTQAMQGHFRMAIFCLAFAGLCDAFDGRVARTKKDRTDDEKLFGIQLDSLCDVICFGVFPAMICYLLGVRGTLGGIAIGYYCLCAVMRLAFFNVLETNRLTDLAAGEKVYHGLPVTSVSVILPLTFLLDFVVPDGLFTPLLTIMLFVTATCFILDFRMKRPRPAVIGLLIAVVACAVCVIFLFSRFHPAPAEGELERPFIDELIEGETHD